MPNSALIFVRQPAYHIGQSPTPRNRNRNGCPRTRLSSSSTAKTNMTDTPSPQSSSKSSPLLHPSLSVPPPTIRQDHRSHSLTDVHKSPTSPYSWESSELILATKHNHIDM